MTLIEQLTANEQNDRESALVTMKSIATHIEHCNYNSAISSLSSVAIMLASAESNHRAALYVAAMDDDSNLDADHRKQQGRTMPNKEGEPNG